MITKHRRQQGYTCNYSSFYMSFKDTKSSSFKAVKSPCLSVQSLKNLSVGNSYADYNYVT